MCFSLWELWGFFRHSSSAMTYRWATSFIMARWQVWWRRHDMNWGHARMLVKCVTSWVPRAEASNHFLSRRAEEARNSRAEFIPSVVFLQSVWFEWGSECSSSARKNERDPSKTQTVSPPPRTGGKVISGDTLAAQTNITTSLHYTYLT